MEDKNKMIMDDVVETKVSDVDMANVVTGISPTKQQFTRPRKTRTIIRKFDKKVMPNDPCPCGSGKKYKKCCKIEEKFEGTRELTAQEMGDCRFDNKLPSSFKEKINN